MESDILWFCSEVGRICRLRLINQRYLYKEVLSGAIFFVHWQSVKIERLLKCSKRICIATCILIIQKPCSILI